MITYRLIGNFGEKQGIVIMKSKFNAAVWVVNIVDKDLSNAKLVRQLK